MNILGIETSCDETAAAVVKDGRDVLSSVVSTQIPFHKPYSGVVPELASRAHVVTVNRVVEEALKNAQTKRIDAIGVTVGPGLAGSLLVGKMTAQSLGWVYGWPVIGINHIEGHLLSPLLEDPHLKPPFLGLVVSGGHTELIYVKAWNSYFLLGRTRDDAAGEAFDKVAKMMSLGYPGGPVIDRLAKSGRAELSPFPKPWLNGTWDFSFSGLKTAVLYKLREKKTWTLAQKQNICAGFQRAVVDVLVGKTMAAAAALKVKTVVAGGGVAANSLLRAELIQRGVSNNLRVLVASPHMCTDNAAMIASVAYFKARNKSANQKNTLKIQPQLHLPFYRKTLPRFEASLRA